MLAAAVLSVAPAHSTAPPLTAVSDLVRIYDDILDADFAAAQARLEASVAPAPARAVLTAVATWWRIQLDPENRALDPRFTREVEQALGAAAAWTAREPARAEAWFYLGGAYGARVQWRVLRGERIAAARDGKRIKDALERALALDASLHDAYFGIGLYHYYADVAPTAAKVLRFLLFLPGGDREQGLREMLDARDQGELVRGEADYQLHLLYLWYEKQPRQAIELLQGLRARYPHNPWFVARLAEVTDVYLHDHVSSLALYDALGTLARERRVNETALAATWARLGLAEQYDALAEPDRAIEALRPLVERTGVGGYDAVARAHLTIGLLEDRLGRRDRALRAYQAAAAAASDGDPYHVKDRARIEQRRTPDPRATEAARRSIDGWRALERRDLADADAQLTRAAELKPSDPVIQYRLGRLWAERRQADAALTCFRRVIAARPAAPPTFLASAYYESGRLLESSDRRAAIDMYAAAARVELADPTTRDAAAQALRRLRAP